MNKGCSAIIGKMALDLMKENNYKVRLHSAFAHAINFLVQEDYLVTLLPWGYSYGPLYILLKDEALTRLRRNIGLAGQSVDLSKYVVFEEAVVEECSFLGGLREIPQSVLLENLAFCESTLKRQLGLSEVSKYLLEVEGYSGNKVYQNLKERWAADLHGKKGTAEILGLLYPLIGLGPGLTPSGDDIIYGMMAAFRFLKRSMREETASRLDSAFRQLTEKSAGRTTLVSSNMLRAGSMGRFIGYVLNTTTSIASGSKEEIKESLNALMTVGSSSGSDMAVGIVKGIEQFIKEV